jgi:anti-sigma-K factor RskA
MPHLDPEELSLLALYGKWEDADSREHLAVCPACASDYAALRRTVDAVKTSPDTSSLSTPGPQVWAGIHRELGLSPTLQADPLTPVGQQAAPPADDTAQAAWTHGGAAQPATPEAARQGPVPPSDAGHARVYPRRNRAWWQRTGTWMAAAAAAALVAVGGIWALNRPPQPQPLAEAQLTPLAEFSATGSARVVETQDGARTLEVTLDKDEAQGYQEVWLIAPDLSRLVSLGVMNSDSGTFQVPAGLELAEYPIVDVSDEPVDGNPAHSSVSIVRGTLTS